MSTFLNQKSLFFIKFMHLFKVRNRKKPGIKKDAEEEEPAFASLFPDMQVLMCYVIPVRVKWLAYLDGIYLLYQVLRMGGKHQYMMALLPILAILNYLIFFGDSLLGALRWKKQQFQHKNSHQTIHFKQAARQAKERTGYLHKCCVCGRTDADYPDLEFRYCSKCAGYRCYCMDHINNHVHVTEE